MEDYILSLADIVKSFGGVSVLDHVNFNLKKGSIHALVGGNGAGKSTLMKILMGVYTCDSGTIRINGTVTKFNSYKNAQKNGISLIFQELSLIPTLTIAENIFLNKEIKKGIILDKKEMNQRTRELLEGLGIDIDVEQKVVDLTVGHCQLVEIAKALSTNASVLIMDEPTASLSDKETEILFKIIQSLKSKGVSIIYISHRMNEIFRIADEISVLRNGKIVAVKPIGEYTMKTLIQDMMGSERNRIMEWKERDAPVGDEILLQIKNLSLGKSLNNISFELKKGEVLGLSGLMGSGRTEIMECLFGIQKPDSGEIKFDGVTVSFKNNSDAIDAGIVLVPEDRRRQGLVLMHALKENIILTNFKDVKKGFTISNSLIKQISDKAIKELKIVTGSISTKLINLSGGNQQKVVIAKWLNRQPKLLLLDEPTAGVDIVTKVEIIDIVRHLANQGKSVIFVSSELSEIMAVCDRILVLHDGKITKAFYHKDIENEEVLQHAIQN